jgi:uncharacterized membrane protein
MERKIFRKYIKLPLLGATYLTIALAALMLFQAAAFERLWNDMHMGGAEKPILSGFFSVIALSPINFIFLFILLFLLNWIVRVIFFTIHKMESDSNNSSNRTESTRSG